MKQVFVTPDGLSRPRWREAFADAVTVTDWREAPSDGLLWLDQAALPRTGWLAALEQIVATGRYVILLSPVPDDAEAFAALSHGARGYCHQQAAPQQLREVSLVVQHGGIWMPVGLVERMVGLSRRVLVPATRSTQGADLTAREQAVAERVAQGFNNREIADDLGIAERTVKAHMSTLFEKLGVRDRVQLALAVNGLPVRAPATPES